MIAKEGELTKHYYRFKYNELLNKESCNILCGFVCLFGGKENFVICKKLEKNLQKYTHRGPDHQSFYKDNFFACSFKDFLFKILIMVKSTFQVSRQ